MGSGAFGTVYMAQHIQSGNTVAIKMMKINTKSMYNLKKVVKELSILRQLSAMQGNIFTTNLYDVIVAEEALEDIKKLKQVFLVMEHFDYDLRGLFNAGTGGFSAEHATTIMYNMLCAIKFIHSTGIIHRDLKPANILIDNNCMVKICDFGISTVELNKVKKVRSEGNMRDCIRWQITNDISLFGSNDKPKKPPRKLSPAVQSRWYRSPEVIMLDKKYDTQIDIWSVGCIFYELLNFQGKVKS